MSMEIVNCYGHWDGQHGQTQTVSRGNGRVPVHIGEKYLHILKCLKNCSAID